MEELIRELKELLTEEEWSENELMSRRTTFKVGGPAKLFLMPEMDNIPKVADLLERHHIPLTIIGNGSNLLVSDKGIDGAVLAFGKNMDGIRIEDGLLIAQAGTMLSKAAVTAMQRGLSGMEFAGGIPGSVGGAIVMNAGAYGGEMKDITAWVKVLTKSLDIKYLSKEEMQFCYRNSCISENKYLVLEAALKLSEKDPKAIKARMDELKEQRIQKQPLEFPSAGSTFKRPKDHFAGKLIMDAGLAGYAIGGARVSEKHCGFVINQGGATAADVYHLIRHVQKTVKDAFGVELETEVKMLGEF